MMLLLFDKSKIIIAIISTIAIPIFTFFRTFVSCLSSNFSCPRRISTVKDVVRAVNAEPVDENVDDTSPNTNKMPIEIGRIPEVAT